MNERLSAPQTQAFSKDVYLSPPARSLPNFRAHSKLMKRRGVELLQHFMYVSLSINKKFYC